MPEEPKQLTQWDSEQGPFSGKLFTCARPGRSKGRKGTVADGLVDTWVKGLPGSDGITIISLLGRKTSGKSEFSYYSFRGGYDKPSDRLGCPTFQEWLDGKYGEGKYRVIEYPTTDTQPIDSDTMSRVAENIRSLVGEGRTVVLMDSGGCVRVGRICKHMGLQKRV